MPHTLKGILFRTCAIALLLLPACMPRAAAEDMQQHLLRRGAALVAVALGGGVTVRPLTPKSSKSQVRSLTREETGGVRLRDDAWSARHVGGEIFFVHDLPTGAKSVFAAGGTHLWTTGHPQDHYLPWTLLENGLKLVGVRNRASAGQPTASIVAVTPTGTEVIATHPGAASAGKGMLAASPDGSLFLLDVEGTLVKCEAATGQCEPFATGEIPSISPDGHLVAYRRPGQRLVVASLHNPSKVVLQGKRACAYDSFLWSPDGQFVIAQENRLVVYRIADGARLELWKTNRRSISGNVWIDGWQSFVNQSGRNGRRQSD